MQIEYRTKLEDVEPKYISPNGRLCSGWKKIKNMSPDIIEKDDRHIITYLRLELNKAI